MLIPYNVFKEVELPIKSLIAGVRPVNVITTIKESQDYIRTATAYATAALSEGQRSNEFHVFKGTTAHAIAIK